MGFEDWNARSWGHFRTPRCGSHNRTTVQTTRGGRQANTTPAPEQAAEPGTHLNAGAGRPHAHDAQQESEHAVAHQEPCRHKDSPPRHLVKRRRLYLRAQQHPLQYSHSLNDHVVHRELGVALEGKGRRVCVVLSCFHQSSTSVVSSNQAPLPSPLATYFLHSSTPYAV